ncbi:TetR/AcrR family transcriptional regulator [Labrys portucalensis]|uniref:TetR/AcrR family transcriptional regulator n=1 Tax=Labrys neptuniae TaxID=376174 RepID=A0ABV6ZAA3_9HYPH
METKERSGLGRPRSIDRNKVLDAAEAVVARIGPAGLTIDAVAKEAGITKGGVQYCFGTKDGLLKAMLERWAAGFDTEVARLAAEQPGPFAMVRAYVEANRHTDEKDASRSAAMLATLIQSPDQLADTRAWYRRYLTEIDPSSPEGRKARLAFLASEGIFFLHSFQFVQMTEAEWQEIFEDIMRLLPDSPA